MGYLTIDSEDLNSGRFSGTVVYFGEHQVPTPVPVIGVISSLTGVDEDGGHTYGLAFTNSSGPAVAFSGTIVVYPGAIGITGQFSAEGVTGQVKGSAHPIAFYLYITDADGSGRPAQQQHLAPPLALAHAIDAVFAALPHLPLMTVRK